MKSNVIFILVDSVYANCISNKRTFVSCTPFIDSLKKHSIYSERVFSLGPYTDAATKSLYTGTKTLDNYGYYFGLNSSPVSHFEIFKKNGYKTYGIYYPYYLLGNRITNSIDYSIYSAGFKFSSVWHGKFEYYSEELKKRPLTELEYNLQLKCLDLVFEAWFDFYRNLKSNDFSCSIVIDKKQNNCFEDGLSVLEYEYFLYKNDKKAYLEDLLSKGMAHPLANVNKYDYGGDKDFEFLKSIYVENKKVFKKIKRKNFWQNFLHSHLRFNKCMKDLISLLKTRNVREARYLANWMMLLESEKMMEKRSLKPCWQDMCSFNKQISAFFNVLDKTNDEKMPFYASFHILEPHHNISYFSYDSFDHKLIKEELKEAEMISNNCGKKFKGNLLYQLSLKYVDSKIRKLFDCLKERDLLNNTTVVLVSDHGTSYSFNPIRNHVVNTFHKENYNVPLLIWNASFQEKELNESFYSSDDVLPTLCDVVGLKKDDSFTGSSLLEGGIKRDFIITEYMGPGVPDMNNRDVWISIRSDSLVIGYKQNLNLPLRLNKPAVLYNLVNDPYEFKNLNKNNNALSSDDFRSLANIVKNRFDEIVRDRDVFLRKEFDKCS